MMDNKKSFSIFACAIVALLSCCNPVSSQYMFPRVSRTNDAIIIDYEGVGYSPFSVGRGYGQVVNPGFIPLPAFNPYGMVQPQPMFYSGWPYFGRQSVTVTPAAATCGKGPATMPTARTLASERLAYPDAYATTAKAKKGAWPFMVALKGGDGKTFCAGSLISDSKVLLAAQCLEKLSVFDISAVTVLVGMYLSDLTDVQMTRRISKVVIHSKYNAATYANDIAIISLDMPVVLSKSVFPVCLAPASADPDQYADQNAMILGWDSKATTAGTTLEQALVSISANSDCKTEAFGQYVSDLTICVTSTDKFTCPKDVGGPVVIGVPPAAPATSPVTWTLVGINSFTDADCTKNGLKTRVSAFADWIKTYSV